MAAGRFPLLLVPALVAALALGGCVTKPKSELAASSEQAAKPDAKPGDKPDDKSKDSPPAAAPAEAKKLSEAESDPGPPLMRHEAAGQCWMVADKRGGSIDAKTKIVDKCIDDKLKADATKRGR